MNNKTKFVLLILLVPFFLNAQTHIDQNGWKTSVSNAIAANTSEAIRYEIAAVGYNSVHWQGGGVIFIELFNQFWGTGYVRYVLENGYGQGASWGSPVLRMVENYGVQPHARIVLGSVTNLSSSNSGASNQKLPIYLDVKNYSAYKVKFTYLQERVDVVNDQNQISFNFSPTGTAIPEFTVASILDNDITGAGNLKITGSGAHYIENGNVGVGTKTPSEKLSVNGKIRAKEIKIESASNTWPDYVFKKDYPLPDLSDVEKHIQEKGHLPEVPSAKEVEKEGIALGANQAVLLKKIEELTLYMIEQDKINKAQAEQIKRQATLLQELQTQVNKKL
jgi:hypothetical protein